MARPRTNLRKAARHTGDLYERGYQYEAEREFTIEFGPWKQATTIVYNAGNIRNEEARYTISDPHGVIIRADRIEAVGYIAANTALTTAVAVGAKGLVIDGTYYAVMFYRDTSNSDYLTAWTFNGAAYTNHASTLTSASERVEFVVWGDDVYFTHSGIANVYKYNKAGTSFAAVAGSPGAGEFIFTLGNNVCIIKYNTTDDVWEVYWAVDSTPTDWAATGSGNNVIPTSLGNVQGVGFLGESAYIVCQFGAYRMTPTGSATPAFSFSNVPEIEGCVVQYGVATGDNKIFYTGRRSKLMAYSGGQVKQILPVVYSRELIYSGAMGCVVNRAGSARPPEFIDTEQLALVGRLTNLSYDFDCDGPAATSKVNSYYYFDNTGGGISISNVNPLAGSIDSGNFYTPFYDIGTEIIIKEIDILKVGVASQMQFDDATSVYLYVWTNNGSKTTHTIGTRAVNMDGLVRFPVHAVGRAFSIRLVGVTDKFQIGAGVRGIRIHCRTVKQAETSRIKV